MCGYENITTIVVTVLGKVSIRDSSSRGLGGTTSAPPAGINSHTCSEVELH